MKAFRMQIQVARRWRNVGVPYLLMLALSAATPLVMAAEEPQTAIAADAVVPQANITLEARRLPLSQVLAEVKKQTGVTLTSGEGTFAREPKLTMAVSVMPLREWMESLATLYDVAWQADGPNAFQLRPSGRSEDEKALLHIGNFYNYWAWASQDAYRPKYLPPRATPDWKALVDDNLDLQAIVTTGVPLADAPAELQRAARAEVEYQAAVELLLNTRLLNGAKGPLNIAVARPEGSSGYIINEGLPGEKRFMAPLPLTADITDTNGETTGRFDFRPSLRGRDLLGEYSLFPPNDPGAAPAATTPQGRE